MVKRSEKYGGSERFLHPELVSFSEVTLATGGRALSWNKIITKLEFLQMNKWIYISFFMLKLYIIF